MDPIDTISLKFDGNGTYVKWDDHYTTWSGPHSSLTFNCGYCHSPRKLKTSQMRAMFVPIQTDLKAKCTRCEREKNKIIYVVEDIP